MSRRIPSPWLVEGLTAFSRPSLSPPSHWHEVGSGLVEPRGHGHSAGQERTKPPSLHRLEARALPAANDQPGSWEAPRLCRPWSNWSNEMQLVLGEVKYHRTRQHKAGRRGSLFNVVGEKSFIHCLFIFPL